MGEEARYVARLLDQRWGEVIEVDSTQGLLLVRPWGGHAAQVTWWREINVVAVIPCEVCDSSGAGPCTACEARGYMWPKGWDGSASLPRFGKSDAAYAQRLRASTPVDNSRFQLPRMHGDWYTDPDDGFIRCWDCHCDLDAVIAIGHPEECPQYDLDGSSWFRNLRVLRTRGIS